MMDEGLRVDVGAKQQAITEGGRKGNEKKKETRDDLRINEPAQIADRVCEVHACDESLDWRALASLLEAGPRH
jgi:hypothetical protein